MTSRRANEPAAVVPAAGTQVAPPAAVRVERAVPVNRVATAPPVEVRQMSPVPATAPAIVEREITAPPSPGRLVEGGKRRVTATPAPTKVRRVFKAPANSSNPESEATSPNGVSERRIIEKSADGTVRTTTIRTIRSPNGGNKIRSAFGD
jgi:hypothetical protein